MRSILFRILASFSNHRHEEEFDEEVQGHLAMLAERFMRQGMSPEEAAYAAKRQLGSVTRTKESLRERRALINFDALLRDLTYAFRQMKRALGFTATAILTLALGIGATTAVFAVVYAVLLKPLPYPNPNGLVLLEMRDAHGSPHSLSYPNFFDLRASNQVFEHMVSFRGDQFTLSDTEPAIHVDGEIVAWDLFQLLRIRPELGRGFLPEEERAGTHVVVLSHELWQSRFAANKAIVGHAIRINGDLFTVVGVAPSGFVFPPQSPNVQLWTPLSQDAMASEFTPLTEQRGAGVIDAAMARLKPGIAIQQAQAQMDSIARSLAKQYPDDNRRIAGTYVESAYEVIAGITRTPMLILLGAVGLLLLIACANVANLLLARSAERRREFALRAALGASRPVLSRQLLVESLLLGFLGSAAGVLFGLFILRVILPFAGNSIPRIEQTRLDGHVLAFSIGLAILTSVLFGIAPVLQVANSDPAGSLKDSAHTMSTGHSRVRSILVVAQISLGLVLVSGAELLIASFLHLEHRDLGFQPSHLLTFSISVPNRYNVAKQIALSDRLLQQLRTIPGVISAAFGMPLPLMGNQMTVSFDIEERRAAPCERSRADIAIVSPGYFAAMDVPILKGRDFTDRDDAHTPPVLVVNEAFAKKFFPGENVIGKRIQPGAMNGGGHATLDEIAGIVGNAKQSPLTPEADPIYYFPYKQLSWGIGTVILRTSVPPLTVESAARTAVANLDKQMALYQVQTMDHLAYSVIAQPRFQTLLLTGFSAVALLLTAVGLFGMLAYSVTNRRREIGIRMALGAEHTDVVGLVIRQAILLVGTGLLCGLAGAIACGRLLRTMLYGATFSVALLLSIACAVLAIAGLLAALGPALRATSVDPIETLRSE